MDNIDRANELECILSSLKSLTKDAMAVDEANLSDIIDEAIYACQDALDAAHDAAREDEEQEHAADARERYYDYVSGL